MNRRHFLGLLTAGTAGFALNPHRSTYEELWAARQQMIAQRGQALPVRWLDLTHYRCAARGCHSRKVHGPGQLCLNHGGGVVPQRWISWAEAKRGWG